MTRLALSIVLVVILAATGIVVYRVEAGSNDATVAASSPGQEPETTDPEASEAQSRTLPSDSVGSSTAREAAGSAAGTSAIEPRPTTSSTSGHPGDRSADTASPSTTSDEPTTADPVSLVIPETLPYPSKGAKINESFQFDIACIDTETVTCDLNANGKRAIGTLFYTAHGMPYLYSEAVGGNHDHAWWVAGDREGYRCAYTFMYDKHPNPFGIFTEPRPAEFIARATVARPIAQGYAKVNDKYMDEGVRFYNGTLATGAGKEISEEDCQATALDDFDYDSYVPHGPDQIRVGLFRADGEIGDIRDFTDFQHKVPGHFEFLSFVDGRVTILHILGATNKVSHVLYYDVLGSGRIAVEVNGVLVGG